MPTTTRQLNPAGRHRDAGRCSFRLLALSILLATTAAQAESLEERKYWRRQTDDVEGHLKAANEECGTAFSFEFVDKGTFREKAEASRIAPSNICNTVLSEIVSGCADGPKQKKAIAAKVRGITCTWGDKRSVKVKNGLVVFKSNVTTSDFREWIKAWLKYK